MSREIRWILASVLGAALLGSGCRSAPSGAAHDPAPPPSEPTIRWDEAGGLHYLEVVPAGISPDAALPMVVFIHGLGDRPRPEYVLDAGGALRARFVLPRGLAAFGQGFSWFPYRLGIGDDELEAGIASAAAALTSGLRGIVAERPTRGRPIVCGFSQGGMLTFALALAHPELVEIAHPIAGYLPPGLWPAGPRPGARLAPIRAAHGTADDIVPFAPTDAMSRALASRGFDVSLEAFDGVRHTQSHEMVIRMGEIVAEGIRRIEGR